MRTQQQQQKTQEPEPNHPVVVVPTNQNVVVVSPDGPLKVETNTEFAKNGWRNLKPNPIGPPRPVHPEFTLSELENQLEKLKASEQHYTERMAVYKEALEHIADRESAAQETLKLYAGQGGPLARDMRGEAEEVLKSCAIDRENPTELLGRAKMGLAGVQKRLKEFPHATLRQLRDEYKLSEQMREGMRRRSA